MAVDGERLLLWMSTLDSLLVVCDVYSLPGGVIIPYYNTAGGT